MSVLARQPSAVTLPAAGAMIRAALRTVRYIKVKRSVTITAATGRVKTPAFSMSPRRRVKS
jgi:hypothetical protein